MEDRPDGLFAAAVERTGAYVARESEKDRRVEPLVAAAGREHGGITACRDHGAGLRRGSTSLFLAQSGNGGLAG
jgi:hypothetical protein